jgi:O-antigen ligase
MLPAVVTGAVGVVLALALIPGLADSARARTEQDRTAWDRRNVATAATRMAAERPLLGFGFNTFAEVSEEYFWQADDIPLTAHPDTGVHNAILANIAELGIVGTTLWLGGILAALITAWTVPGPRDLRAWRIGLLPIAVFWLVLALFTPAAKVIPLLLLLLWAGVAAGPSVYLSVAERARGRFTIGPMGRVTA